MNVESDDDDYDDDAEHRLQALSIGGTTEEDEHGLCLLQKRGSLDPDKFYLDTCATYSSCINQEYLINLQKMEKGLHGHCNAGTTYTDQRGYFGSLKMWFNPSGIANLISFDQLERLYDISYCTRGTNKAFIVHTPDGDITFQRDSMGLPYINAKDMLSSKGGICLINTVQQNYEGFTKRQILEAEEARRAVAMVGHPTEREFLNMVRANMIRNCNVTPEAVKNAYVIFGPDLDGLRGKTTQWKPERVLTEYVEIPRELIGANKYVVLGGDVMFVNGVPFLVTAARGLNLTTLEFLDNRTATQLAACLGRVIKIYHCGGFQVSTILMDNEFEAVKDKVPEVVINTTRANEHVGEIERKIWLIKE
ncbi:hypothetical protein ACHAXS_000688, partial [Conticribra weissflogii]